MTSASARTDNLEVMSRWLTRLAFALAFLAVVAAPVLALYWSHLPFPGFVVEGTQVVSDGNGEGWTGRAAGIAYPERVTRLASTAITSSSQFIQALASHAPGDRVSVFTQLPNGHEHLYPAILLTEFPTGDVAKRFWLPYLVGLAYLATGIWVYSIRGGTRPGRTLAFFSICTAIASILFFDLTTTHAGQILWTAAIAMLGGSLISLALRFPVEWGPVGRRPWLLGVPYGLSLLLAAWGTASIVDQTRPWAYISAWGTSYRYAALGIFVFLSVTLYRAIRGASWDVRRQARLVLMGSLLAFGPIAVYFLAPLVGRPLVFNVSLLLPGLLVFPVSVAMAILRYRLWDVDLLFNRTIVFGALTAILAGLYTASIGLSQRLFVAITGEKSDAAIVITTLIVASAFTPVKNRLQVLVERHLKDTQDDIRPLSSLGQQARSFVEMNDPRLLARRLLEEIAAGLRADTGIVTLLESGRSVTAHVLGPWHGEAQLSLPIEWKGQRYGLVLLGPRSDGLAYTRHDIELLREPLAQIGAALALSLRQNAESSELSRHLTEPTAPAPLPPPPGVYPTSVREQEASAPPQLSS